MLIYHARKAGLGNRIRALIGHMAISEVTSQEFRLLWQKDNGCQCEFEDILEHHQIKTIGEEEMRSISGESGVRITYSNKFFDKIYEEDDSIKSKIGWHEFRLLSLGFLSQLKPSSSVCKIIENFCREQKMDELEGIHIRHSDNITAYAIWAEKQQDFLISKISQVKGFIKYAEAKAHGSPNPRFFIASDCQETKRIILSRLGSYATSLNVQFYTNRSSQRSTSIEMATAELFLLSKCHRILGTYYSSFSKVGALIGQSEYREMHGCEPAINLHYEYLRGIRPCDS